MRKVTKENEVLWEEVEMILDDKQLTEENVLEVYAYELDEPEDDFDDGGLVYTDSYYDDIASTAPDSIERRMYSPEYYDLGESYYEYTTLSIKIPEDTWLIIHLKDNLPDIIGRCVMRGYYWDKGCFYYNGEDLCALD